jgi:hypothetical protein
MGTKFSSQPAGSIFTVGLILLLRRSELTSVFQASGGLNKVDRDTEGNARVLQTVFKSADVSYQASDEKRELG